MYLLKMKESFFSTMRKNHFQKSVAVVAAAVVVDDSCKASFDS
jgi:hypothetical protein